MARARLSTTTFALAAAAAILLAGCRERERPADPAAAELGRPVLPGAVRSVSASADGAWLAALEGCAEAKGQYLPAGTASCTLTVVPAAGGEPVAVARAVTTLPQGVLWSPAGATLAALGDYEVPSARGALVLWRGGEPRRIAEDVSYFAFGADGTLGYVARGRLGLLAPDGAPLPVPELTDVATFELFAGGRCTPGALVRRTARAGGALLELCGAELRQVASGATDYAAAPAGGAVAWVTAARDATALWLRAPGRRPERIGSGAQQFSFSRDGAALAYVSDVAPGRQGNLHLWSERGRTTLAEGVGEYQWAAAARRLVWLERYDPHVRSGRVGAGGPGLAPRSFADHVSDAAISPDGAQVAFLRHSARGGYTVELGIARLDPPPAAEAPAAGGAAAKAPADPAAPRPPAWEVVASGVFGFAFSPDARWLYYRTRCVSEGADACDLERVPAGGGGAGAAAAAPEVIASGISGFAFAPGVPGRLLLTWRSGPAGSAVDLGVWEDGAVTRIDRRVAAGSARFLPPDARRLAYVVEAGPRAGAVVADLPRAAAPETRAAPAAR